MTTVEMIRDSKNLKELMNILYTMFLGDEKYDNKNYIDVIKTILPKDVTFVKLNKAPFGFNFIVDEKEFRLSITNTEYYVREV